MLAFRWRIYKVRKQMEQQFGEGFGQQSGPKGFGGFGSPFAEQPRKEREGEVKVHKTRERPRSACRRMWATTSISKRKSSSMLKIFELIGRYFMLMGKVFSVRRRPPSTAGGSFSKWSRSVSTRSADGHHLGLHRRGHHVADVHQPRFAVHSPLAGGLRHARDDDPGVFVGGRGADSRRKGRVVDRLGDRNHAHHRTDRRARNHGRQLRLVPHPPKIVAAMVFFPF